MPLHAMSRNLCSNVDAQPTCPPRYHMGPIWADGYSVGLGWRWASLVGRTWDIYGLGGHGFEVGSPCGFHMGYIWAKWAGAWSGQPYLGPTWDIYGLSGHGLGVGNHIWVPHGFCVGSVGWVRTG